MTLSPPEVLEHLLEGEPLDLAQLDELLTLDEGQHLEFKDGLITQASRRKQGRQEIRQAVSAFANSEGGLLVVGVTDKHPRRISPCEPAGTEPLSKWAESLIHDMAHAFSPPPRIVAQATESGPVLIIAVPRAPILVQCITAGKVSYYLRVGESTLQAPSYLLSDLLLGRRQSPHLQLERVRVTYELLANDTTKASLSFYLEVANDGLVHVDHLLVGVVSWVTSPNHGPVNRHLRSYLRIIEPKHPETYGPFHLLHLPAAPYPGNSRELAPFGRRPFRTDSCQLTLSNARVTAAAYLLPRGSEPTWYQVTLQPPIYDPSAPRGELLNTVPEGPARDRPTVSWDPILAG